MLPIVLPNVTCEIWIEVFDCAIFAAKFKNMAHRKLILFNISGGVKTAANSTSKCKFTTFFRKSTLLE